MTEKRNLSGLEYVGEFKNCPECVQPEATGPYLYKNLNYVPRAFWTNTSVLLVGKKDNLAQISYGLLAEERFNLTHQIFSYSDAQTVGNVGLDELKKHKAVILTQDSVDQTVVLQKYKDQGGIIIPDVLESHNEITQEDIEKLLNLTDSSDFKELAIKKTPNSITLSVEGLPPGFIVMNEKMHLFPGWNVYVDDHRILDGESQRLSPTNILLGRFYLDKPASTIRYEYAPDSFETGKKITIVTLIAMLAFLVVFLWQNKKKKSQ